MRATRLTLSKITKQSRPLATTPLASSTPPAMGSGINSASFDSRTRRRGRTRIARLSLHFGVGLQIVGHTKHAVGEASDLLELPVLDLALDPPIDRHCAVVDDDVERRAPVDRNVLEMLI